MDSVGLKVLMISSDRNILLPESAVSMRMKEYGALVKELHIVLLSNLSHRLKETQIEDNVWVYPTNSLASVLRPLSAFKIAKKIVLKQNFMLGHSVLTTDSIEGAWVGLRIKHKWHIPLEVQIHTDLFSPFFRGFQNFIRKIFARRILMEADKVRVVSRDILNKIKRKFSFDDNKIFVLPIYVNRERVHDTPTAFDLRTRLGWKFIILSVSRLSSEKNLGLALEVISRVRSKFPNAGLVIVGSGPEEGNLRDKVKKMGIEKGVVFEGWQKDLASYYKTATIFIQTSWFEGYGLSLVEAGLSGLPVVSTPVGIAAELDAGRELYTCSPNDPDCFTNAILELLENDQKRESVRVYMKHALDLRLLSKEAYLREIKRSWEEISKNIKT